MYEISDQCHKSTVGAHRTGPCRRSHLLVLWVMVGFPLLWRAPLAWTDGDDQSVGLYEVVERSFVSQRSWPNGFLHVDMDVTFTHQTDPRLTITLPAFWNGKDPAGRDRFSVRFAPTKIGPWKYRTRSAQDPSLDGLEGPTGKPETLRAVPSHNPGFVERGDRYHFRLSGGGHFFPVGTTAYEWIGSQSAEGPALDAVVQFIKRHFNKVRLSYMSTRLADNAFGGRRQLSRIPENGYYWYSNFGEVDSRYINLEHWQRLDGIITKLQAAGVHADLILARKITRSAQVQADWLRGIAGLPGAAVQIGDKGLRYFVGRYAAYSHLWWCIANEYPEAGLTRQDISHIGRRLDALDPYPHPLSVHWNDDWQFGGEDWASHGTLQAHGRDLGIAGLNENISKLRSRYDIPFINEEYGYEGRTEATENAASVIKAHWALVLGGGYGGYGHSPARLVGKYMWAGRDDYWQLPKTSILRKIWPRDRHSQTREGPTPPPASVHEVARGQGAAAGLGHMRDWMNAGRIGYWSMTPANDLVSGDARNAFCLAAPGREYLLSAEGGTVEIDLKAAAGKFLPVEELDPMSGAVLPLGNTGGSPRYRRAIPEGRFLLIHIGGP